MEAGECSNNYVMEGNCESSANDGDVNDALRMIESMADSPVVQSVKPEATVMSEGDGEVDLQDVIEVKVELIEDDSKCVVDPEPSMLLHNPQASETKKGESKGFPCPQCSKVFRYLFMLNGHIRSHGPNKIFLCSECGEEFSSASNLKRHRKTHGFNKSICCSECDKCFTDVRHLEIHKRVHAVDVPHVCTHCGMQFVQASSLKFHLKLHSGESSYQLNKKKKVDSSKSPPNASKYFKCEECEKSFAKEYLYQTHMDAHVAEKNSKLFTCSHCDRQFLFQGVLQKHMNVHVGEKPYKCEFCDKTFTWARMLKEHHQSHTGEIPHQCPQCGDCFRYQYTMQDHQTAVCNPTEESLGL